MTEAEELELLELEALEAEAMAGGQRPKGPRDESESEAALQGFGKGATFGYLPELQAGVYQAGEEIANLLGADIGDESYEESVKAFEGRQQKLEKESPTISKIAEVGGAMAIPVPGAASAKGATALGRIGRAALGGAAVGAATGALQKTSDETPRLTDDPMANLKQRLINAGYGLGFGGIAGGGLTAIGEGIKKAAPYIGRASSGVPVKAIKTYADRADEINAMKAEGPTAPLDVAEDVTDKIKQTFFNKKAAVGKQIGKGLEESNQLIKTDDIFQPLYDRLDDLMQSRRSNTEAGWAEVEALDEFIQANRKGLPDAIDAETAFQLQDVLADAGDVRKITGGFQARYGNNATTAAKQVSNAAQDAYKKVSSALDDAAGISGVKSEYRDLIKTQKLLKKYFDDPEKTFKTLSSIDAPSKVGAQATVKRLENQLGSDLGILKDAEKLEAYRFFQDPELLPLSSGGTTSTSRTLSIQGLLEALGAIGGDRGQAFMRGVGGFAGGPAAVKGIIDTSRKVGPYMGPLKDRAVRSGVQTMTPWLDMKRKEYLP